MKPVVKTYAVDYAAGTVTYRHTAVIGGRTLEAAYTVHGLRREPMPLPHEVARIDRDLERQMLHYIKTELYPQ
jgi:hypothetical protein